MINLYECHFIYNDVNSRVYDLIIANIETSRFRAISGGKKGVFLFNRNAKANELMGDDYKDSPLTIDIEILTCNGIPLDLNSIREIERWLFTNSIYRPMYIDISDDPYGETYEVINGVQKRLYFNCRFLDAEKIESHGGVIGFKCKLETDSTMLWQEEITHSLIFNDPIEYDEDGAKKKILLGDTDGDGRLTADDAQTVLLVSTMLLAHPDASETWETLHSAVDDVFADTPSDYTLISCDMDYTPADFDAHTVPHITIDDAQRILVEYTCDVAYTPSKKTSIVIEDGKPTVIEDDNTRCPQINIDSDIDGYTYPVITIYTGSSVNNTISIFNTNDPYVDASGNSIKRETEFTHIPAYTKITIDSSINYVSGGYYQNMTKKFFPRFVEGTNILEISGDISTVEVTWQNRRFL